MSRTKASSAPREWAAYVRVSKVNGREGDAFMSPDQQEQAIRREVPGRVVKVFKDLDFTGTNTNRPDLQAMLAWLREDPKGRGVGVYDYSRLSRKMKDCLALAAEINDMGALLLSIKERIDTSTATGEHMFHQFASMYHLQARQIGERWIEVQEGRVEKGLPSGGPIRFGYEQVSTADAEGKVVKARVQTPHPVNGPVLAQMYEDFVAGQGAQKIAKGLNDRGVPSPRGSKWNIQSVLRTLDSGFGAGKLWLLSTGEYVDGKHEPVISAEQWERYRRVRAGRRGKAAKHKSPRWHLAGLARCGLCGGTMTVSSYANPHSLITCGTYKNTRTCAGMWVKRSSVEKLVFYWLGTKLDDVAKHADPGKARDRAYARALTASEKAQARLDKLSKQRISTVRSRDDLSPSEYRAALAEIDAESAAAAVELAEARADVDRLAPVEDVYDTLVQWGETHQDPAEYNVLLSKVIDRVEVHKDKFVIVPVVGKPHVVPRV